jgi:hypothetical protein
MKAFGAKNDEVELAVSIDGEGIIRIVMSGNLSSDHDTLFAAWCDGVREAMREAKARDPERVFCVIDVTGGVDADKKTLGMLIELVKHNKEYATRTGVFGANPLMRSFMDIALKAARRTNMKAFPTQEEAEHWVLTGERVA